MHRVGFLTIVFLVELAVEAFLSMWVAITFKLFELCLKSFLNCSLVTLIAFGRTYEICPEKVQPLLI